MIRFVFRPRGIRSTPRAIAQATNSQTRVIGTRRASYTKDFLFGWPQELDDAEDKRFTDSQRFFRSDKASQREYLILAGIKSPRVGGNQGGDDGNRSKFVVRPRRHRGGEGFRITNDPKAYDPRTEYIQEFYPKAREYRVIFVFGTPLITLLKRVPEDTPNTVPWNHSNGSTFVTVNNEENNRLRHTDVVGQLLGLPIIQDSHIVAADIMLGEERGDYRVCELNFAPALTIQSNIARVVEHIQRHRSQSNA